MRFAQAGVGGPDGAGSTYIDLTYFDWADNTWYCPSGGLIGATSGTWTIGRDIGAGTLYLYSGGELIGSGDGFATPDYFGYPFNDSFLNLASTMRFYKADAAWSFGRYAWANIVQNCTWYMTKI